MNPLGFSTLGCPGEPLDHVLELAKGNNVAGLELRTADDEFTHLGLTAAERRALRTRIEDAGLEILAVNSYVKLCAVEEQPLEAHLELAADLGARGVRVFPGDDQGDDQGDDAGRDPHDDDAAYAPSAGEIRALDRVTSAPKDSRILLETHDSHSAGHKMAQLCRLLDAEAPNHNAKVIWDSAHTWSHGETPAEAYDLLKPWIDFIQIKDEDSTQGYKPVPIGSGDYPIADLLQVLQGTDYWLSLEWELKWHPHLPPLAEALPATLTWLS